MLVSKLRRANALFYPKHLFYGPSWVVLGVNNICNLHCKMCDVGVDYQKSNFFQNLVGSKPLNMPLELVTQVIDQTAQWWPTAKLGYAFTEPLIYPHLFESLVHARRKKMYTSITTNALNLRRYADQLLEAGVSDLFISLDGPPEVHNFIRGHKSSFEKAMEGMEYLLTKPNRPGLSVYCTITEWNIGRLAEFAAIFKHMPLKTIGFFHTQFAPQEIADQHNHVWGERYFATASNLTDINPAGMDLERLWEDIQAVKRMDLPFPVSFSPEIAAPEGLDVLYHHPEILMGKRCVAAFNNIMVKSNGNVIPSHGRCYNISVGNLYENDLKTIWNSAPLAQLRTDLNKAGGYFPGCSRCCSAYD